MTFKELWDGLSAAEKQKLAKRAKTGYRYLSQIANGHRRASRELAQRLAKAHPDATFEMFGFVAQ